MWFGAALVQLQLSQAAHNISEFKAVLLGSGAVDEAFLK